jgi:(S)-mandelate dehydrogenase
MGMRDLLSTAQLESIARRRLPRPIFDFIAGGAGEEQSLKGNEDAFRVLRWVPRSLERCVKRSLALRVLDQDFASPFGVSPMGLGNLAWPGTDHALMTMASRHRIPYVLSTAASTTLEQCAQWCDGNAWFQIYPVADFNATRQLLQRAQACGIRHLVFTVDAAHPGRRLRDRRSGFGRSLWGHPASMLSYAMHPSWTLQTLRSGLPRMVNLTDMKSDGQTPASPQTLIASMAQAELTWDTLRQVRDQWPHFLIVKGVLDPGIAPALRQAGVDAIQLSNHGARQLGSVISPLSVVSAFRAALGPHYPLFLDSGARSGEDVAKALSLGVDLVFLGRSWLYATAALAPQDGALRTAEMLRSELDSAMAKTGCADIQGLRRLQIVRDDRVEDLHATWGIPPHQTH